MPSSARRAWRILSMGGAFILVAGIVRFIHGALVGVENPLPSPDIDPMERLTNGAYTHSESRSGGFHNA